MTSLEANNASNNTSLTSKSSTVVPPKLTYKEALIANTTVILKADTGASGNYIRLKDALILKDKKRTDIGPKVRLPDNSIITTNTEGHLPLKNLPHSATHAHIFPDIKSASLLSIGQLCDSNCTAIFTKNDLTILNEEQHPVLNGVRNTVDGLWDVPLKQPNPNNNHTPPNKLNAVLRLDKTKSDLALFLHAAAGYPTKSTLITAIKKGYFMTWPGLTTELIQKYLPTSVPTIKGHIKQEQQNLRSTKILPEIKIEPDTIPPSTSTSKNCFFTITTKETGTTYSDLTGRYPITSSRGNQYIIICYDYDTNSIQAHPTKTRNAAEIRDATISMLTNLSTNGHQPQIHIMDNEASTILKQALLKYKIKYQLVPPHIHRRNAAERAIQTFKAHFISILCGANPKFPVKEWDRLLPQTCMTLNMLRTCRYNSKINAYTALNGLFDYNKTPFLPLGTQIIVHEKPDKRRTWAPRGTDAWYIGPAMEHYRCLDCYIPSTHSTRIADTVELIPSFIPIPKTSTEDYLRQSVDDILSIISSPTTNIPSLKFGSNTTNAIKQIAQVLHRALPLPPPIKIPQEPTVIPTTSPPQLTSPPVQVPRVVLPPASVPRVVLPTTSVPRVILINAKRYQHQHVI